MKMPPGPQCTVCGREYPALAASSSASIVCVTTGLAGVGLGVEHVGASTSGCRGRAGSGARAAARDRRVVPCPRGTARSSMRSSRSGAARCRRSAARPSRPRRRSVERLRVAVDHGDRILRLAGRVESRDVGELLGRRRDRGARAAVKRGICCSHDSSSARAHFAGPPSGYLVSRRDSQVRPLILRRECGAVYPLGVVVGYPLGVVVSLVGAAGRERDDDGVDGCRCGGHATAGNTVTWFQRVTPRPYSSSPCTSNTHEFPLTKISPHSNKHARTHSESFDV